MMRARTSCREAVGVGVGSAAQANICGKPIATHHSERRLGSRHERECASLQSAVPGESGMGRQRQQGKSTALLERLKAGSRLC